MNNTPDALSETLPLLSRRSWRSTREIHAANNAAYPYAKVSTQGIANRLQRMKALEVVQCRRVGRAKHWKLS